MDDINGIAVRIICSSGDARSYYMEALGHIRKNEFEQAQTKIKQAKESFLAAHQEHSQLLKRFSEGAWETNLLLTHAQDHMTSAEIIGVMAEEILSLKCEIAKERM